MSDKRYITTRVGLDKLKAELEERKTIIRTKIADKIEKATALGDLSENASYTAALEEQQMNEAEIAKLDDLVQKAIVKKTVKGGSKVDLGDLVTIVSTVDKNRVTFELVSEQEASPKDKKYSLSSPIGSAVFEKKVGDLVVVKLPSGAKKFKIEKIS